jgi:hypothetical protein
MIRELAARAIEMLVTRRDACEPSRGWARSKVAEGPPTPGHLSCFPRDALVVSTFIDIFSTGVIV